MPGCLSITAQPVPAKDPATGTEFEGYGRGASVVATQSATPWRPGMVTGFGDMAAVMRLVTVVDIDGPVPIDAPMIDGPAPVGFEPGLVPLGPGPSPDDPRSMSLSALHLAVLQDGRRLILLDDRGWSAHGPPDIWRRTSTEEVEETARMVVGPDEPFGSHSQADMKTDHWTDLAGILRQQGVLIGAEELSRLPHDVKLTERLRLRLTEA